MIRKDEGQEFASAAMMRLVTAGLLRQGIDVALNPPQGAHVPRMQKRDLLDVILKTHGPKVILSIADAAPFLPPEPVVQALTRAVDTGDLLDRWHRLERFSHGRHMVKVTRLGEDSFRLNHCARDAGPPPSLSESLLVLGLLTILTEMIGAVDVSLAAEEGEVWRENGIWLDVTDPTMAGSLILTTSPVPRSVCNSKASLPDDPVDVLRQRLLADPLRRWTVAALATEVRVSQRTLQRRLTERSISFSRIVSETRLQVAASFLCDANGPGLAEIGFLAGFSDQAHFSRTFSRAVGATPRSYRGDFGQ
jgi:AraC-like DNA-binding protein